MKLESGTGGGLSTVVSVTDTQYDSCACSPMGKTAQVSMPHAPNAAVYWTVYSYDSLGRTVNMRAADGSTKTYQYQGNTVTVTDEAGTWEKYAMNALGNLTQVTEPDPDHPMTLTYVTSYGYDLLGHLVSVNMPRPSGVQTRTFNYGTPPGAYLLSATNPESGTTVYSYGSNGLIATKTDAKNQQTQYSYDNYARLTQIRHYPVTGGAEDTAAQVNISYDTNPYDGQYSRYAAGRMTARQYTINGTTFTDMYSYTVPGQVGRKRLRVTRYGATADLEGIWSYDNEGRLASVMYPAGQNYTYGYDGMGRPSSLFDQGQQQSVIGSVQYGPAGELLSMTGMDS